MNKIKNDTIDELTERDSMYLSSSLKDINEINREKMIKYYEERFLCYKKSYLSFILNQYKNQNNTSEILNTVENNCSDYFSFEDYICS